MMPAATTVLNEKPCTSTNKEDDACRGHDVGVCDSKNEHKGKGRCSQMTRKIFDEPIPNVHSSKRREELFFISIVQNILLTKI